AILATPILIPENQRP
nr:Mg-ATPase 85 kda glycoprotein component {N-terminal} {EC 3.6.1.3} [chickens, skeletal muscle transverse tubule membrane, Peptide Partial, 15 aa] [Gallus gallus]